MTAPTDLDRRRRRIALGFLLLAGLLRAQEKRPSADDTTWNRRPPGAGEFKTVVEVSGRDQLAPFRLPSNPRDLQSVCAARTEARALARTALEEQLAAPGETEGGPAATAERAWAHHDLGQLLAYENRLEPAIAEVEAAHRLVTDPAGGHPGFASARERLEVVLGVLNLRLGELQNCLHDHNADRCIFPIRGRGEHEERAASEAALRWFEARLRRHPEDLEVRWLLNVAAMTLGRHPEAVPEEWLIPPAAWASPEDPGRFPDVAPRLGLDRPGRAGGAVVDDLDGDGRLDVVLSSVDPCAPLRYYRRQPDGRFADVGAETGLRGQLGGINLTQADYDNDGRLDLFVMRGGWEMPIRDSLLHQKADGGFEDVTEAAGLSRTVHRTHSAAFADFDGDGWLDLFVGHEESPSALFRNRGDGTFEDVSVRAGVERVSFVKGVAWGDYDNDGRVDLYVSNYGEPNFLYHNEGHGRFREVAAELGVDRPLMSFPTWFFDYDNDGWLDLFVASFVPSVDEVARGYLGLPARAETMRLYRNAGGRFEDVTREAGLDRVTLAMGANFGDPDDDGFPDLYLGTGAPSYAALVPNLLFRNRGGRGFADVTTATGTGHLQKGHGVAFADLDEDGDTDLFCNIGGFVPGDEYPSALFANPGRGHAWVDVRLVGVKANRAAIGARLRFTLRDRDGSERRIERVVTSGGSFGSSPLAQRVGLGTAAAVTELAITWPGSGARQVLADVPLNAAVEIREGTPGLTPRRLNQRLR
jgi:hypothetical protein